MCLHFLLFQIQSISNVSTARIEDAQSECSRNLETASLPGNIGTISSTTGAGTAEVVNSIMDDLLDEAVKSGTDTVSVGSETPNLRRIFRDGATSEAHTPTSDHGVTLESFKVGVLNAAASSAGTNRLVKRESDKKNV